LPLNSDALTDAMKTLISIDGPYNRCRWSIWRFAS
jgi:hypothetical protein